MGEQISLYAAGVMPGVAVSPDCSALGAEVVSGMVAAVTPATARATAETSALGGVKDCRVLVHTFDFMGLVGPR